MPEIFANTTPLQYLHRLGRLGWLRGFYGRIVVPVAVAEELQTGRRLGAHVPDLANYSRIEIRVAPTPMAVFPNFVHRGEAEVLALAQVAKSAVVIIDDLLARKHAQGLGIRVTETLGIILRAKREQRVASVAPILVQLQAEGFHIAPATLAEVLQIAGE